MVNSQLAVATSSEPTIQMAPLPAEIQSVEDLISTKALANGVDPILANKIAFCESTMRQFDKSGKVLRGIENSDDVGLFQINENYHIKESQDSGYDIHTTEGNIDYAMQLIREDGVRHWKASRKCWSKA
jgi:hypothetical protein